jgi:glycosyltransferase involved in cell wall biosynthesis
LERELGVPYARRRGIREASADLIIFVDDDNVLDKQYLSEAVRIKKEWPLLGLWGSGSIHADFEVKPPDNVKKFLPSLALRDVDSPRWANFASCPDAIPWGAGLCIRKEIARAYCRFCDRSSIGIISRQGTSLFSGEDREMSFVSCSRGLGIGIFPTLKLTHLISQHRLSEDYMIRLGEGHMISNLLLDYKWLNITPRSPFDLDGVLSILKNVLFRGGIDRRMRFAEVRAVLKAKRIIRTDLQRNRITIKKC